MKTVKEWFESIKEEDVRQRALANMKRPDYKAVTLAGAIEYGFNWIKTAEGDEYWYKQWYKALNNVL